MKTKNTLSILFALVFIFSNVFNVSASSTAPVDAADKRLDNFLAETDDAAWTAYNDCSGTTGGNTTTYTYTGSTSGLLKNYETGANTSVTATFTYNGSISNQTSNGAYSNSGTDAYSTFYSKANMVGVINYASSTGWYVDVTFTGLDSTKKYTFATTANRADSSYSRDSKFTISDITAATNASTSGVSVISNESVYFNTGYNTVSGYVARWTGIQSGPDGDFKVRVEPNSGNYGYGPSVFMLQEEASTEPAITTSSSMTTFYTPVSTTSAEKSYTVSGENLTESITVTTPDGFEISNTSGGTFGGTVTLGTSGGTVYVRFVPTTTNTYSGDITHTSGSASQNLTVNGSSVPAITITGTPLSDFSSEPGTPSDEQSYSVSGINLTESIVITAPGDFEISTTSGGTFGSPLSLSPSGYVVSSTPIYVRFERSTVGSSSGNITHSSTGVTTQNVAVSGTATIEPTTVTFQEDVSSYAGTIDTTIKYNSDTTSYGSQAYIEWDTQESSGTTPEIALLQFNDIFGSGTGQIPIGSTISSATLQYRTYSNTNSYGDSASVYESLVSWDEDKTYSTFGGESGVQTDEYDSTLIDTAVATARNTYYTIDVTVSLQNWSDGEDNFGWIFMPENTDGVEVHSSEASTSSYRPLLTVTYLPPSGPTITTSGTLTEFSAEPGVASAVQTYSVSGSNLEGDITITAPTGFEISDDGTTYASSLTLVETNGVVEDTTIYVRLYSATEGIFSGNIKHESTDATTQNVAVSGSVLYVYTLIVGNDGNGTVTLSPTGGSYKNGTTVTLIPAPNTGFAFDSWSGTNADDVIGTSVYTIVVDGNKSLDANFIATQTCETVNLVASEDTYMSGVNTTNNYGASTTLKVTNNNSDAKRGGLFNWDVSNIPSAASVSSASLTLYVSKISTQVYNLYNMQRSWEEGTGAGSVTEDGATWLSFDGTNTWGAPGATSTTTDRFDTNLWDASTSSFASTTGSKNVSMIENGIDVIQGWIDGTIPNYGLSMQNYSSTSVSDDLQFASSENGSYAGPTLNVTYCVGVDSHTLTVGNDGHGTVTLDPSGGVYEHGTVVELTPVPATGYEFATWSGANASDPDDNGDGTWSIIMNEDKSITANFTELPVNVAPDLPVLVQPADAATGVSPSPTLEVTVSDDNTNDTLDVSFYGRETGTTTSGEDFTLIVIPDTQNLAQYYSSVMYSQFQWIANNKTTKNIAFATSVGDIVNTSSSTTQWDVADAAYDYLDADDVAYSVGPGNHDIGGLYSNYFGSSRFSGKSYYQGYYTSGNNNYNNYSFFSASGNDIILINLEYNASGTILTWADALLKANTNRRGIVVIHNILNTNNSWQYETPYTSLKDNPNLFLMLCGHMHTSTDGSAYRAELGDDEHTIHILMTDYQDYPNGGNGYLRILRFSPADDKIYSQIYSPYTNGYLTNASNYEEMEMVYDLANGTAETYELIGTVEDVTNGANASLTWVDLEENTEYEWYATVSDGSETVTGSTWGFSTGTGNVAPVVSDIPNQTIAEGSTFATISLDNYVSDVDDTDAEMTWTYSGNTQLAVSIVDRVATITIPGADWNGSETITFRATDPGNLWDEDAASFVVTEVNDPPVITGQSTLSTAEDTSLTITLDDLTVTDIDNTYPTGFSLTILAGTNYSFVGNTITPASNFNGSLTVPVKVNDGAADSNTYNLNVTVTPLNDAPVITEGAATNVTMSEDGSPTAFNLTLHVTDADSGDVLTWSILSEANDGTASASGTGEFKQIGYIPDENFNGSDRFVVEVSDGNGGTDTITVNVTIEEVNDPPIAVDDTDITPEDFIMEMDTSYYLGNDLDPDNMTSELIITEVSNPTNGSVVLEGTTVKFTPAHNFFGIGGFDYTLSDGELTDTAHVEVTVIAVNDAPVAV